MGASTIKLPAMHRVAQKLVTDEIADAPGRVVEALDAAGVSGRVRPGMKIALTAGSRGIDRIGPVLSAVASWLRGLGADPFLVPAMGSHGGGGVPGRAAVLEGLGISGRGTGVPGRDSGEVVELGRAHDVPVYCLRDAAEADGIVVINRVKPHTSFTGTYESGLVKMMAVGLGMAAGATAVHSRGAGELARLVPEMAGVVMARVNVLAGLALVENGVDRLETIEAMASEKIMEREPHLLERARRLRPCLPFDAADVLVVDRLGKDVSGTGMDTRVIGRMFITGEPELESPRIRRIVVLRLTPGTGGNAYGIGLADVTTEAVVSAMKPELARANAMASTFVERARVPLAFPSDREAIAAAVAVCGNPHPEKLRIARIHDTLNLADLLVSAPLLETVKNKAEIILGPIEWDFDRDGNLSAAKN